MVWEVLEVRCKDVHFSGLFRGLEIVTKLVVKVKLKIMVNLIKESNGKT